MAARSEAEVPSHSRFLKRPRPLGGELHSGGAPGGTVPEGPGVEDSGVGAALAGGVQFC